MAVFQVKIGYQIPLGFLPAIVSVRNLWNKWHRILRTECPSPHPANTIKQLENTKQ